MSDEESQRVAGHLPAVKAGGMRIVQHKTPHNERPAKDNIDVTGLTSPPNINNTVVPTVHAKGHADNSTEAAQVAHAPKPPVAHNVVNNKPGYTINQPRK